MSIFTQKSHQHEPVKRNTFDLSFNNNLTMDIGKLYPVFCKEVLPTDSFRIKPSFGLRLDPTVFPLQSKMRADLHFFYVRNRNLWENWQDYITAQLADGHPFPYLDQPVDFFKTGSLADYLGIPTTIVGDFNNILTSYCPTSVNNLVTMGALPAGVSDDIFYQTFGFLPTSMRLPWHIGFKYSLSGSSGLNCFDLGSQYLLSYAQAAAISGNLPGLVHDDNFVAFTYYDYLTQPLAEFTPNYTTGGNDYYVFNYNSSSNVNVVGSSASSFGLNSTLFVFANPDGVSGENGVSHNSIFCGCVNVIDSTTGRIELSKARYDFLNDIITSAINTYGSCFLTFACPYSALNMDSPTSFDIGNKVV